MGLVALGVFVFAVFVLAGELLFVLLLFTEEDERREGAEVRRVVVRLALPAFASESAAACSSESARSRA